ncbi:MAG: prepilin-type N-terminal cleavage/methylation domain-containing protein [bacterium]|nr:prepilin-type N-terminal cleavage/methylation domain-containing protein [bacterium]
MQSVIIKLPAREPASRGYTLIELMVALTIAALLFLVGYASYREFIRRQALDNTYKELKSDLKLAQQLALSGEKPSSCTGALFGYQVAFAQDSYTVSASCGGMVQVRTRSLSPGITLSGANTILYKVIGEGTTLTGDISITLTQTSTGRTKVLEITKEGTLK